MIDGYGGYIMIKKVRQKFNFDGFPDSVGFTYPVVDESPNYWVIKVNVYGKLEVVNKIYFEGVE